MTGIMAALAGTSKGTGAGLDTQTVTTGTLGTAPDRIRGYNGSIGSIVDGTSNIYGGAAITQFIYDEGGGSAKYVLTISGATNSGWTEITIDGVKVLTRATATFVAGTWTWFTADTIVTQAFGANGTTHVCVFT